MFTKFRRRVNGGDSCSRITTFCDYGIVAREIGILDKRIIESSRRVLSKVLKNSGRLIIRVYPDISVTKKPIEVRMGSGKGDLDKYVFKVKKGNIIFEFDCFDKSIIRKLFLKVCSKFPIKLGLLYRDYSLNIL